jgi:hypothetical protein
MASNCTLGIQNLVKTTLNNKPWFQYDQSLGIVNILDSFTKKINKENSHGVAKTTAITINKQINDGYKNIGDIAFVKSNKEGRGYIDIAPTINQIYLINAQDEKEIYELQKELDEERETEYFEKRSEYSNEYINDDGDLVSKEDLNNFQEEQRELDKIVADINNLEDETKSDILQVGNSSLNQTIKPGVQGTLFQVKNIFNSIKELEKKLSSLNKTSNSIGSNKNLDDILKKAGIESNLRKEFIQLLEDNKSLKSLKLSEVLSSYLKEFIKESDRQYYKAIDEPLSQELENTLIQYFDKFHIRRKELDNLKEKFGVDSIGVFDVLAKTIYYSKNRNLLTLPEEYGHVFVELLGSIGNKKADNPLFKYMFDNIDSWDGYQRVYRDYKNIYLTAEGNTDIYKIKKEAIGQAIGIALVRNYKVQKGDKDFWGKIQEIIDYILNLIKGIDYVSLNTTVDNIAKDILSKNYSKLDRLKKDTSNYSLLSYSETIKNQNKIDGGKALKFMQWFSQKGMIITGSLAYRLQGNVYRPEIDALHDIDNIVPSDIHGVNLLKENFLNSEQLEQDKLYRKYITEGNYNEAKKYKIQGNLKLNLKEQVDKIQVLKDFKLEFPDTDFLYSFYNQKANAYYVTINAIWSENKELKDRFKSYSGSFNSRLENFTKEELEQIYLFDFFLRPETTDHFKKIEDKEYGLSLAHFNYSFYEKLNMMGRPKDAFDYQMWDYNDENNILAPDFNDRLVYFQIDQSKKENTSTDQIKPGVEELFESNPELANQVYKVLGFTNELLSFDNIIETDNKEEKKEKLNKRREIVLKEINAIEELIRTNPDEITIYYTALYENDYQQTKYFDKTNWEQSTEKYKTSKVISKPSYLHSHLDEELQKRIKNLQVINSSLYSNIEEINYSNIFQIGKNYSSLEILKYISNNKKDVLSSIAEKLLKYSEKNNVEVSILEKGEKSNVAGSYSSLKNKIEIYGKKSITSHTLIHEIVHSLSVIDINLNPDSKQVKSLKNILKNILDKKILKEYENFESSYEDYATKNIKELLSEIISRPDILSHLALYDTNYDLITSKYKKETLLDEIIKIISDIFNFTKRESETLADAILLNAVEIFENSRTTSNYQSTEITPQQKQQAQQLYSQYLESLNKPNTNPILQGNQQEQAKKFTELQERLSNKEFLEGAKNAFESSEELQNVYYEAAGLKKVYHGSKTTEKYFEYKIPVNKGVDSLGVFFTSDVDAALLFTPDFIDNSPIAKNVKETTGKVTYKKDRSYVKEEYLKLQNPYIIDIKKWEDNSWINDFVDGNFSNYDFNDVPSEIINRVKKVLIGRGHDGIYIAKDPYVGNLESRYDQYIVFDTNKTLKQQKQDALNAYTDYLARVSLGIIKNPSSGEYNYYSKVKDIVYHFSTVKIDKPNKEKFTLSANINRRKGFFGISKNINPGNNFANVEGTIPHAMLFDMKNPDFGDFSIIPPIVAKDDSKDSAIIKQRGDIDYYSVFEPEQIHILGSKQDVEGFKEFLSDTQKTEDYFNEEIKKIQKESKTIDEKISKFESTQKIDNKNTSKALQNMQEKVKIIGDKLLSLGFESINEKEHDFKTSSYITFKSKLKELENLDIDINTFKSPDYLIKTKIKSFKNNFNSQKQGELPFNPIELKIALSENEFIKDIADNTFEGLTDEQIKILKENLDKGEFNLNCKI